MSITDTVIHLMRSEPLPVRERFLALLADAGLPATTVERIAAELGAARMDG